MASPLETATATRPPALFFVSTYIPTSLTKKWLIFTKCVIRAWSSVQCLSVATMSLPV